MKTQRAASLNYK